ncbi:MAG: hypothetical protein KGQ41_01285 [Alphaproteobacteria bacterium]|nr:hypothetical protein [Alphaproteobacteria bacterium]
MAKQPGLHAHATLELMRLERERPAYMRMKIWFGMFDDDQKLFSAQIMDKQMRELAGKFDDCMEMLGNGGIERQDLKDEFNTVMAIPDDGDRKISTVEGAQNYELQRLSRLCDAQHLLIASIRRLNEADMAARLMMYRATYAMRGLFDFDEKAELKKIRGEGRRALRDLRNFEVYLPMYHDAVEHLGNTLMKYGEMPAREAHTRPVTCRPS